MEILNNKLLENPPKQVHQLELQDRKNSRIFLSCNKSLQEATLMTHVKML